MDLPSSLLVFILSWWNETSLPMFPPTARPDRTDRPPCHPPTDPDPTSRRPSRPPILPSNVQRVPALLLHGLFCLSRYRWLPISYNPYITSLSSFLVISITIVVKLTDRSLFKKIHTQNSMAAPPSPPLPPPRKPKEPPSPTPVPMASATFYLLFLNFIPGRRLSDGVPIRVARSWSDGGRGFHTEEGISCHAAAVNGGGTRKEKGD